MSGVIYTSAGLVIGAAVVAASPHEISRMPTLTTMLQVGQILSLIGGAVYVALIVGKRDAVLQSLAEAAEKSANKLQAVAEQVAEIRGQLNPSPKRSRET